MARAALEVSDSRCGEQEELARGRTAPSPAARRAPTSRR
ncbi:hypothetical protein DB32_002163 [Sandaracinus amylolyticus]|uniref:Uncharacterized protein n=1 Tax=Sandaracinus amylolyticus TaxID=927083 RepID=A0A0F6SED7_9BACT|nr:hypothetical protein DB32_002163 [Sandaracinus amylolyticus]